MYRKKPTCQNFTMIHHLYLFPGCQDYDGSPHSSSQSSTFTFHTLSGVASLSHLPSSSFEHHFCMRNASDPGLLLRDLCPGSAWCSQVGPGLLVQSGVSSANLSSEYSFGFLYNGSGPCLGSGPSPRHCTLELRGHNRWNSCPQCLSTLIFGYHIF